MEGFEVYGQRYESFNLPKELLKRHEKDKDELGAAFSYCISQAKQKNNHLLYKNLINEANAKKVKLTAAADYDPDWVQRREQEFRNEFSKKESELKLHMANNIKPSVQMSYLDLAKLLIKAGDFKEFEQFALRAHEVQPANSEANYYYKICLLLNEKDNELRDIIDKEIDQENFKTMTNEMKTAYLHGKVISGISRLKVKDFFGAFNAFSTISPEYLSDIGIYTSFYDLARYLAVLGIICCKREEAQSKILSENAKQLLNHNQTAIKLVESFINANYEEASKSFSKIMAEWAHDSFVSQIGNTIQNYVLDKLIKQYLSTISRVRIQTLAETFKIQPGHCEDIIQNLILTKKVPFRIDRLNQALVLKEEEAYSQSKLVKKATGIIGNYCFEKQFAVIKVSFNTLSGARQKGKGIVETFME